MYEHHDARDDAPDEDDEGPHRLAAAFTYGAERFTIDEIGERDGWICQLCLDPVDLGCDRNSADGASIDHIVAVSNGGEHTRENAWLAHKSCNSAKGNRTEIGRGDLAREPRIAYRLSSQGSSGPVPVRTGVGGTRLAAENVDYVN